MTWIALCIENSPAAKYLSCVALEQAAPGLGLRADGSVTWEDGDVPIRLFVDELGRLVLRHHGERPLVHLIRDGRTIEAPPDETIPLLNLDQLLIVDQYRAELRVHVHGPAAVVAAPQPVPMPAVPQAILANPPPWPVQPEPPPMMFRDAPPAPMPPPPDHRSPYLPDGHSLPPESGPSRRWVPITLGIALAVAVAAVAYTLLR